MEVFKRIKDFPNYEVSRLGNVRNTKTKLPSSKIFGRGRMYVYLRKDNKQVGKVLHQIVAKEFLPNPNEYKFIRHLDEDMYNNHVNNLEWVQDTRKAKNKHFVYKTNYNRLEPDYEWIKNIKILDKKNMEKLNHFK